MKNPFQLTGKTVLVTGATSGIGRQSAISASQMGAQLVITGRDQARLDDTFSKLDGAGHLAFSADLTVPAERDGLVGRLPKLDGIVHCAGIGFSRPFHFNDEKHYHQINATNVEAPLFLTQRILKNRKLNSGASLIFLASLGAFRGCAALSLYAGSKAALVGMMRSLASELSGAQIRVNCISPGMVRTEMTSSLSQQITEEAAAADERLYPFGYGTPEDVANAVVYFLSPASRWVTGIDFMMNGGWL